MKPNIGSKSRLLSTPRAFDAHVSWGFGQNIAIKFGTEKNGMVWLSKGEKIEDMFIRFDRMHVRTWQTHGQTDGRTPHDG